MHFILQGQISKIRDDHTLELKEKLKVIQRLEKTIDSLKTELAKEKNVNKNLEKELSAKEKSPDCFLKNTESNNSVRLFTLAN